VASTNLQVFPRFFPCHAAGACVWVACACLLFVEKSAALGTLSECFMERMFAFQGVVDPEPHLLLSFVS